MQKLGMTALGLLVLATTPTWAARPDCEPARCAVQATIAAECPCDAENHGRYVSCVAHVVKRLSAPGGPIPTNCKGKVTRCAARSTCGKPGFVTCLTPTDTCDVATSTCVDDPALACLTDLDCGAKCKVRSSGESCVLRGGTVGVATNCCATCAP